jgi:hypothetical protein
MVPTACRGLSHLQVPMIDKPEARRFPPPFKESTLAPR